MDQPEHEAHVLFAGFPEGIVQKESGTQFGIQAADWKEPD
jgi:hypothetical protein